MLGECLVKLSLRGFARACHERSVVAAIACLFLVLAACGDAASSSPAETENPIDLSSVPQATPCKTDSTDTCEYGTLTDDRDGQTYKTVKIGDQWWMAENLNLETPNSFCWGDNPEKCELYGRLYLWSAVMDSAAVWSTNGVNCGFGRECDPVYPVYGLCPRGWHVPTFNEWRTLFGAVGGVQDSISLYQIENAGKILKSSGNWLYFTGIDSFGFNALPAGFKGVGYTHEYRDAYFWTSSEEWKYDVIVIKLTEFEDKAMMTRWNKDMGLSVRCVKN